MRSILWIVFQSDDVKFIFDWLYKTETSFLTSLHIFMRSDSILKTRSFDFAVRIINLYKYLKKRHSEFELSNPLFRSGTSIGALIREAEFAESRNDFKHKLKIGLKEANESV